MSVYQIFFEIEMSLCERFPALTPFEIRQERAAEVFLLIDRLNDYTERENRKYKGGQKVIRRRAGDDWF